MQEEVTQRTVALCVESTKLSAGMLQQAMKKVLDEMQKGVTGRKTKLHHGKQTLRQLMHKDSTIQAKQKKDEREEVLKEIRQLENRQKILENKQRNEERKARTRRLIERGAVLEGVFPLAPDLPGVDVKAFLIALSHLPGAAELAAKLPKSGDKP